MHLEIFFGPSYFETALVSSRKTQILGIRSQICTTFSEQCFCFQELKSEQLYLATKNYFSFQAFVRDPDGYYIEFCNCEKLEEFLHAKMAEAENQKIDLVRASSLNRMSSKLKMMALDSKKGTYLSSLPPKFLLWQYGLSSFHGRDIGLEIFGPNKQTDKHKQTNKQTNNQSINQSNKQTNYSVKGMT